ncbi:unnamed protein product [Dicrocoelium dendriticum]|nr:unnamed protein product [Dicrocoelium dendriticum]
MNTSQTLYLNYNVTGNPHFEKRGAFVCELQLSHFSMEINPRWISPGDVFIFYCVLELLQTITRITHCNGSRNPGRKARLSSRMSNSGTNRRLTAALLAELLTEK